MQFQQAFEEEKAKQQRLLEEQRALLEENKKKEKLLELAGQELDKAQEARDLELSAIRQDIEEKHKKEMHDYKEIMEAQIKETGEALKATRRALVGNKGVVAKQERETISPPHKRNSMNSIPDVGPISMGNNDA